MDTQSCPRCRYTNHLDVTHCRGCSRPLPVATKPHDAARLWTPDEVAECLLDDVSPGGLSSRLWDLLGEMEDTKPLGGDGSGGTVEWPEPTQECHSVVAIWHRLTEAERRTINAALRARDGETFADYPHLLED